MEKEKNVLIDKFHGKLKKHKVLLHFEGMLRFFNMGKNLIWNVKQEKLRHLFCN